MPEQLLIGDVTALTGIGAGRIRHYQKIGLLPIDQLSNGYRVFDTLQVLALLRIDLLRSLGVGVADIANLLDRDDSTAAALLGEHRALLVQQRDRLTTLIGVLDDASAGTLVDEVGEDAEGERMLQRLATSHRHSIGVIGRLSRPLPPAAAAFFELLFEDWDLPVPPLFGQMLLPAAATSLMEQLAGTVGCAELFDRLRVLAARVLALGVLDADEPARLAEEWVDGQLADPLPGDVVAVLRSVYPALKDAPVIVLGFRTWATSINSAAACFLDEVARVAAVRGADALSVMILPPKIGHRR